MHIIKLLLFVFWAVFFFPQAAVADSITSTLQKQYSGVTTMRSDFTQTLSHKESGGKEVRKGTLYFKKPLLVRWETKAPSPELLVVTATEIWNEFPDEEVVYKYPVSMVEDSRNIVRVVTGQAKLEQDFNVEEAGQEDGLHKLRLYPHEPVQALVEAILWVDTIGMIKKVRIYDFYGNTNDIAFENYSLGTAIPAKSFTYSAPKGFDVEDRTAEGADIKKPLMQ